MIQTFDDMLADTDRPLARLAIWTRALADLTISATKEHLTNGSSPIMNRNVKIYLAAVGIILVAANGASYWFGNLHARQTTNIERVSPAQIADAMQADSFYSKYGDAALLFSGTVASVELKNDLTLATLSTGRPYGVMCQMTSPVSVGETVTIAAPGGSAERMAHNVLLHNCTETQ